MKKQFLGVLATLLMMPMILFGQTYDSLWKQVSQAEEKDLPQTQLKALQQIAAKAEKERAYGQLMKAELMQARVQTTVSPDSLLPAVERLRQRAEACKDVPLQAIYYAVLGKIYQQNSEIVDDWKAIADDYFRRALAHPEQLAAVKATDYQPFVEKGEDSRMYNHDLLSLIGRETQQYQPLVDYYMTTDNRLAQLLSSLELIESEEPDESEDVENSPYLRRIDSLIARYGDLPECGEAALERFEFMDDKTIATAEQKVAYIDEALSRWGSWKRMNWLRNSRNDLTALQFNARLERRVWIPNRKQTIHLDNLRGISQLTLRFYRVNVDGDTQLQPENNEDYKQLKPLLTQLPITLQRTYTGKKDYELYDDTLTLEGLPVGVYMMEAESLPETSISRTLFFVSDVRVLIEPLPQNQLRFVAVSATTGQPLPGAKLRLTQRNGYRKNKLITTLTTGKDGEYLYSFKDGERPTEAFATTANDRACPTMSCYSYYNYSDDPRTQSHTNIYTDRAIYRPGQTVQVAAIVYQTERGFEHQVLPGKKVKAQLRDANYKVVEEKELLTDDFGTVSTQFTLPSSALTGEFSVQVNGHSQYFRVEEYKRPTFQVEFPKVEQDYKDGDTLTVKATARTYAGVPVQGARVKYKVERRMAFWWMSYWRYWQGGFIGTAQQNEEVFAGEAVTADDGTFLVQMPMVLPRLQHPLFYNFVVVADVTDQAGETHQGQLSLPLGNRKTALTVDLPDKVLAEQMPQVKLHVLNAAGNDVQATVRYQLDGGKWQEVASNSPFSLLTSHLKSGKHTLKAEYEGETLERDFVVFSLDDKRPAAETDDWFYVSAAQFPNDGKPVTVQVGSSAKDVHIVYTLVAGNDIIEQGAIDRSNELVNRKLVYKPEYGNGLALSFAWIKEGKTYLHTQQIQRPLPNKKLTMKWETFRDRLTPGQQEEWTLSIDNSTIKHSQLLAVLYDKSLDQIVSHQWSLEPATYLPMAHLRWINTDWGSTACYGSYHEKALRADLLEWSHFDSDCFPHYWMGRRRQMMFKGMAMNEIAVSKQTAAPRMAMAEDAAIGTFDVRGNDEAMESAMDDAGNGAEAKADAPEVAVRENLQETAFFYPQLLTDEGGRISLKFTLPESLTTWRFMGIAHTQDMMHGYLDGEAVAQKDVMIQPNVPRFLRVGDEGTISARIFNTTDREQSGTARLLLIDPESNQPVYDEQTACLVGANSTDAVSFHVDCSKLQDYSLLVCKMTVSGETFSDGEQHYLPILPNREHVTVTVPFTQNEPGTKTVDLKAIVPDGVSQEKLTFEYTNNPAWLMVQALPTIASPCDKNAISQAASLYANSLGKFILDQNPQAKHVFEMWKRETGDETSMMSALEKDEELKDLMLTETPWVMDADREAEQKQRLADFFDENLMQQRLASATTQLQKLQNADGSWSWWEGMRGSFYMTVEISEMLVRLNQMTSVQSDTKQMLTSSFKFMNKEILELVAEMKKEEKKGHKQTFPSFKALQYLYLSTIDGRKQPANVQEAQEYLKKLLKKDIKNQTIYEKAMSAIILHAPLYIQSLKEYTVYKEEMGRYYDTPRAGYSWRDYRIPTQVAAIEALQRLSPSDQQTIEEMQRWLLQEKRTVGWDTPINSVDAIYAFLNGRSQVLAAQPKTVLKVDGKELETSAATAGIGYVKSSMTGQAPQTFTAEKTSTGTSWGAVYAQFMQPVKDIAHQKSGISVKREILTAETNSKLKVGNRVKVRLTIEADRDYDFVEVVDRRAACMEPVQQLSGYHSGAYCAPKDFATCYYFDLLPKGKRVFETEYYIDRPGRYETGTCTVQCAYAPEFRGTTHSQTIQVEPNE